MAKFSKAHYVILADAVKETEQMFGDFKASEALDYLRHILIAKFSLDNPKFDSKRFLKASEPEVKQ